MSERATDREKSVLQWFCKVFDKYRGRRPEHLSNSIIFVRLRVDFATALTNRHAHLEQVSNPAALSDQARAPWYYLYNTQYNTKYVLYTIHGVQRCIMLPWSKAAATEAPRLQAVGLHSSG